MQSSSPTFNRQILEIKNNMKKVIFLLLALSFLACKKDCTIRELSQNTEYSKLEGHLSFPPHQTSLFVSFWIKGEQKKGEWITHEYPPKSVADESGIGKDLHYKNYTSDPSYRITFTPDCAK